MNRSLWLALCILMITCCSPTNGFQYTCTQKIAILIDVSGSVIADVSGGSGDNVEAIKTSIRHAMDQYLFRSTRHCVSVFRFATHAQEVVGWTSLQTQENRDMLLGLVDTLEFETTYPEYYTNWEAALKIVPTDSTSVYLITDGNPTVYVGSSTPSDNHRMNVLKASQASRSLVAKGMSVVPIGVGSRVSDANLQSVAGPCSWGVCAKGWDYMHLSGYGSLKMSFGNTVRARDFPSETIRDIGLSHPKGVEEWFYFDPNGKRIKGTARNQRSLSLIDPKLIKQAVFSKLRISRTPRTDYMVMYKPIFLGSESESLEDRALSGVSVEMRNIHKRAEGSGLCMNDLFPEGNVTCGMASDVRITELIVMDNVTSCEQGDVVYANVVARITSGATTRYDIGIVVAADGGYGLSGSCYNYNMDPVSVDNLDLNVTGGFGPYYNGEIGTGDTCGDIRASDGDNYVNLGTVAIICRDMDGDGIADVSGGVGWQNQASDGSMLKPHCFGPDDTGPSNANKCRFDVLNADALVCNKTKPFLMDDYVNTPFDTLVTVNVTSNDLVGGFPFNLTTLMIVNDPSNGTAVVIGNGEVEYTPDMGFIGVDMFLYELCDACNPPACSNATVFVMVNGPPTPAPTNSPTTSPTSSPTTSPTTSPTSSPTSTPTTNPSVSPTLNPSASPSMSPTSSPTASPSVSPTPSPSASPTSNPTASPSMSPIPIPTDSPTLSPTPAPTGSTTTTCAPTMIPTGVPTKAPTLRPTSKTYPPHTYPPPPSKAGGIFWAIVVGIGGVIFLASMIAFLVCRAYIGRRRRGRRRRRRRESPIVFEIDDKIGSVVKDPSRAPKNPRRSVSKSTANSAVTDTKALKLDGPFRFRVYKEGHGKVGVSVEEVLSSRKLRKKRKGTPVVPPKRKDH